MIVLGEDQACGAIMDFERRRQAFVLPRYTPRNWWECDVFELTRSGYFREYEVKLTLADFEKDAEKRREIWSAGVRIGQTPSWEAKHALLAAGDPRGPAEFFFVTPVGLIDPARLPTWAGLIELHDQGEGHRPTHRWHPATTVRAPRLHKVKADPKIHEHAMSVCYYRLHTALDAIRDRCDPPRVWQDAEPPSVEVSN